MLKRLGPSCGGVVRIDQDATDVELDAFHQIGVRAIRLDLFARAQWPTTLAQGSCWIKLSGAYQVAKDKPLSSVARWGSALVAARLDRLIWGSDWPHLPDGQRDTGEILSLLADWAPTAEARHAILVDGPNRLFFSAG